MKPSLLVAVLSLCGGLTALAGTSPIFINDAPVQSPPDFLAPIDATVFVNRSTFNIGTSSNFFFGTLSSSILPFETLNTLYYTNTSTGVLLGTPGFRFIFNTNGFRLPAARIVNQGSISVSSYLFLRATNIISTGPIDCGALGLGHIEGDDVTLRRSGLRAAPPADGFQNFGGFSFGTNYINDSGITDQYWAVGNNNRLDNQGRPMSLGFIAGGQVFTPFDVPTPQSPQHQVAQSFGSFLFTNFTVLPSLFSSNQFGAFVFTNQLSPTSSVIQVAFVATNFVDTNFSVEVSFQPDFDDGATVQVEFRQADFDIVNETFLTNRLVFSDSLAFDTNFLARNLDPNLLLPTGTMRPSNYDLTRSPFFSFFGFGGLPPNATFSPELILNPSYRSNAVPVRYSAYSALVTPPGRINPLLSNPALNDPTNFPGRLEILGKKLDLDRSRMRAENTLIIKTADLSSNGVGRVDAPFLYYDLATTQPELVITNFVPTTVRRLSGQLAAWSATWTNYADRVATNQNTGTITTNLETILFHVLILDAQLQSLQPVDLHQFIAHATNLVIADNLTIGQRMLLDAESLHLTGSLTLPPGTSWAATNVLRVKNFTNDGTLSISGSANFGSDRLSSSNTPVPYCNFINRGTLTAAASHIRTLNFENLGSPFMPGSGSIFSSSGSFQLETATSRMSSATLTGRGDVQIAAGDFTCDRSFISAGFNSPGALFLSVSNTMTDGGANASNLWKTTAGFQCLLRPQGPGTNDLLGTTIQSFAGRFLDISHLWPAQNRGATNASGFSNNLAVGRLILDGDRLSQFTFDGVGTNDAMYVDFLELRNNATNYDTVLNINPGFTLYFANANIPPTKLDGRQGGRLRWVSTFAGPNSSTNLTYVCTNALGMVSTNTYTFNTALVQSRDLDSNGNGIVNSDDPMPIFVPECMGLSISSRAASPGRVQLSWKALASVVNHLEFKTDMHSATWQTLTNVLVSPFTQQVTVQDFVPTNQPMRIYRIRMDPY